MKLPRLLDCQQQDGAAQLQLELQPELDCFAGHFPQGAVAPGVMQIAWAEHFGRELGLLQAASGELRALKFQRVMRPGQTITLRLNRAHDGLQFRYESGVGPHSSGRLLTA